MSDEQIEQNDVEMASQSSQNEQDMSEATPAAAPDASEPKFRKNDTVLARVKGHPPWPALVIEQQDLPEQMQKQPKKRAFPVYFLNDHTYLWVGEADLKPLDPELATKNSLKSKTRKSLVEAFRIAAERPTLEEYLEQLANAAAREEDLPKPKRARKAAEKPTAAPRTSRKRKGAADGVEAAADDADSSLVELKKPKGKGRPPKDGEMASVEDLKASSELRTELCRQVRNRLQKAFLMEPQPVDLAALNLNLDQVEQLESLEVAIVRVTKLNKVLRLVSQVEGADEAFKERCAKLLERFNTKNDPVIRGLPESEVNLEELIKSETQLETPLETPAPEDEEGDVDREPNGDGEPVEASEANANGANGANGEVKAEEITA